MIAASCAVSTTVRAQSDSAVPSPAPAPAVDTEASLFIGETRLLPMPGITRIAVGNGQVLTANAIDGRGVLVFANAAGASSLMVWDGAGRLHSMKFTVGLADTGRSAREIATFLSAMPNAHASVIGEKVIVDGDNLADRDLVRIDELAKRYPQIVNFTSRLGWEKMVMMDVKIVEFPTNVLRDIGLKWTPAGGAAVAGIWSPGRAGVQNGLAIGIPTGTGTALPIVNANGDTTTPVPLPRNLNILSALNLGLTATLNLLVQEGKASVLAQPQLSARNGSKASFLAGGEYPYTVSSIAGQTVLFKQYGIKLDITPQVDRSGLVRALIDSEVSAIDTSVTTSAGPALTTRKTSTEFNVQAGETMVLSGLLSRRTSTTIDKVPLLGDLPVIGALFRSKRFQNDETELVVFVTPTLVDAHTSSLAARVDGATQRLGAELGRYPYLPPVEAAPSAASVASVPRPVQEPVPLPVPVSTPARAMPDASFPAPPPSPAAARTAAPRRAAPTRDTTAPPTATPGAGGASSGLPADREGDLKPGRYRVNQYDLPLRSGADFNAPIVGYVTMGDEIEVLPEARRGYFVAVRAGGPTGVTGWTGARWLQPR